MRAPVVSLRVKPGAKGATGSLSAGGNIEGPTTALSSFNLNPGTGYATVKYSPDSFYQARGGDHATLDIASVIGSSVVAPGSPVDSALAVRVGIAAGTNANIWSGFFQTDLSATTPGTGQHVSLTAHMTRSGYATGGAAANPEIWASLSLVSDRTGQPSNVSGGMLINEQDIAADGLDPGKLRNGNSMIATRYGAAAGPAHFGNGYVVTSGDAGGGYGAGNVSWATGYLGAGAFREAVFDARQATIVSGGNALWLADGQPISFMTSGSFQMLFNSGTGQVEIRFNGTAVAGVDSAGSFYVRGGLFFQNLAAVPNAANDAAAATAGVAVGRVYRNGSVLMVRVT